MSTLWINEKFTHRKNISWNQLFGNCFRKIVAFTKFLPKMREKTFPKLPHCDTMHCWKTRNSLSPKLFREISFLVTFPVKTLLSLNFCQKCVSAYFRNLQCVEKTRNCLCLSPRKFRQINYLVTYSVKPLLSRNFCQKCARKKYRNFHTVTEHRVEKREILSPKKYFVISTL